MTASNKSRLDRLEALAETTLLAIQQLGHNQQQLQAQLNAEITDVVSMIGTLGVQMGEMQAEIREMQTEVRGIQTENRRILDYLFREGRDNESN